LTFGDGHDIKPYVASDIFGNVWVAWESDRNGNKDIYLKRFDGTKWSPDIPITSDKKSDECAFIVSDDTSGDIWVAWESDRNGHGNKDIYAMRLYIVDSSAPMTAIAIGDPKYVSAQTYVTSSTPISLLADDNEGVGVASTWFRTWNSTDGWEPWTEYNAPFTLSGLDGLRYIEYNSTDTLGYAEATNNATVQLDNTAPQTSISMGQPSYFASTLYITSSTPVTLSPDDTGSGLNSTMFRIWNATGGWTPWTSYVSPFSIPGPDGTRYLEFNSSDKIGHDEPVNNYTTIAELAIDNSPPDSTLSIGTPQYSSGGITYFTSSTQFTLGSDDGTGSGPNITWYRIWDAVSGWSAPIQYTAPFTISGPDGIRYIEYNSSDNLGTDESPKNHTAITGLFLDNADPATILTFGNPNYTSGTDLFVSDSTEFNISANKPDIAIWVWMDLSNPAIYNGNFTVAQEGPHTIFYNATDNLGNIESPSNSIDIIVDTSPPITTITVGTPQYGPGPSFVTSSTTFTLDSDDGSGSGVDTTMYRIDSGSPTTYTGPFSLSGNGQHVIHYWSIDNLGNVESDKTLVVILDDNPPIAIAGVDQIAFQGDEITFDASQSSDGSGSGIDNYTWAFKYNSQTIALFGVTPSHQFDIAGNYEVRLTVEDNLGNAAVDRMWVNVTISADSDKDGLKDAWELIYFDDLSQGPTDDPDNDGLNNSEEYLAGTDPTNPDSDGDGIEDGMDSEPLKPALPDQEEKGFLEEYWWVFVLLAIVIVLLLLVMLMLKRKRTGDEDIDEDEYEETDEEGAEDETGEEEGLLEDDEGFEEESEEEELEEDSSPEDFEESEEVELNLEDDEWEK
jgi:hypothetical protein